MNADLRTVNSDLRLIVSHELIGLDCEVMESPNTSEIGIKGVIVDETMKMLAIETPRGVKKISKQGRTFKIRLGDRALKLSGELIAFRPEDRIKRGIMLIRRYKGNYKARGR